MTKLRRKVHFKKLKAASSISVGVMAKKAREGVWFVVVEPSTPGLIVGTEPISTRRIAVSCYNYTDEDIGPIKVSLFHDLKGGHDE